MPLVNFGYLKDKENDAKWIVARVAIIALVQFGSFAAAKGMNFGHTNLPQSIGGFIIDGIGLYFAKDGSAHHHSGFLDASARQQDWANRHDHTAGVGGTNTDPDLEKYFDRMIQERPIIIATPSLLLDKIN